MSIIVTHEGAYFNGEKIPEGLFPNLESRLPHGQLPPEGETVELRLMRVYRGGPDGKAYPVGCLIR